MWDRWMWLCIWIIHHNLYEGELLWIVLIIDEIDYVWENPKAFGEQRILHLTHDIQNLQMDVKGRWWSYCVKIIFLYK